MALHESTHTVPACVQPRGCDLSVISNVDAVWDVIKLLFQIACVFPTADGKVSA